MLYCRKDAQRYKNIANLQKVLAVSLHFFGVATAGHSRAYPSAWRYSYLPPTI